MANRWRITGVLAVLILIGLGSIGLYLFARDPYSDSEVHQLIDPAYNVQRPGGGRLSAAPYTPVHQIQSPIANLSKAQLLLLRKPDSPSRQRLQGLLHLAVRDWQKFVDLTNGLLIQFPNDSAILNNMAVSFLAMSDENPTFLLKALDSANRAVKLNPREPEPLFNLVLIYRKLRLQERAAEAFRQYSAMDRGSVWFDELQNVGDSDEASVVEQIEHAVAKHKLAEAEQLFKNNAELARRVAMQFAFSEVATSPELLHFIANEMETYYGDKTVSAMLAPLFTDERDATVAARRLVNRGADLFTKSKFPESLAAYADAEKLEPKTNSLFDELWLLLNKADTLVRLGRFNEARDVLSRLITTASEQKFLWLKAKALTIYGATLRLTSSYPEMINFLSEADREFTRLEAPHDRLRVLYYLAIYLHFGGDQNEALKLALQGLQLTGESDALRISTLDWLVASILNRQGVAENSLLFARESVHQSHKAAPTNAFVAATTLAELYESTSQRKLANEYLQIAADALDRLPPGFDHIRAEQQLGMVKAKARINSRDYAEAERLLQRNLMLYSQQPFSAGTTLLSPTLMLLARVYSDTGRKQEAAQKFTEAIDIIEESDEYMKAERLRVKFDDTRRELYDSAIEFEFNNGAFDAAWTYLQKYRAKLFLEFLAAFNPNIQPMRARLDRAAIQHRISKETQIVEYAMLRDRLLIWVITDKVFTVRSVNVSQSEIEAKVQAALAKLRTEDQVDPLLADLGEILVQPIIDLLDPARTITVVPDRNLHGLPFGALKIPGKKRYLIQDYRIVISPSLTHFLSTTSDEPPRNAITAFASQTSSAWEFKELAALGQIYPKTVTYAGKEVDKAKFLASLTQASIFHYAGHSATDAADPLRSSILLDGNRMGPNSVTAIDISQQRMTNNAVVILSSCDSSVGNSRDGVGVRGLTSAFLIAGAGSVVGSLWPVEASSTADLMIRFHQAFAKERAPVAKALRDAQLTFLETFPERSHPYYWSGFVVTGNFSALR